MLGTLPHKLVNFFFLLFKITFRKNIKETELERPSQKEKVQKDFPSTSQVSDSGQPQTT
jgi:hypothetical protein